MNYLSVKNTARFVVMFLAALIVMAPAVGEPQDTELVGAEKDSKPMSTDQLDAPLQTVQKIYQRFNEGDTSASFDLISEHYEMFEPGPSDVLPWAGRFSGRSGFKEFNSRLATNLKDVSITELHFADMGSGQIMVTGVERGTSVATGRHYVSSSLWIWGVQDGLVVSMRAYHDTEAMAAAFRTED